MAVYHAGSAGFNMLDMDFAPGSIVSQIANTTTLTVTFSDGEQMIWHGHLVVSNNAISSGTVTEVEMDRGGVPEFSIDGLSQDALALVFTYNDGASFFFGQDLLPSGSTYVGSAGTDLLQGNTQSTYIGGSGTETFETGRGANSVTGGSGVDVLVYYGASSQYNIVDNGDGSITVTDSNANRNGTDHIANVPFLQFTDKTIFDLTSSEARVALLYQGALGRTPDPQGLIGWIKGFVSEPAAAQGADNFTALAGTPVNGLPDLAYGFTQSTEFQNKYGTLTDTQFVTQLYANVLDRAPDTAGLNSWVSALGQGHTREWVLVGFVESDEAYHNAEVGYTGQTGTVHAPWLFLI